MLVVSLFVFMYEICWYYSVFSLCYIIMVRCVLMVSEHNMLVLSVCVESIEHILSKYVSVN